MVMINKMSKYSSINRTETINKQLADKVYTNIFLRGIVVEMFNDPSYYSDDELVEIYNSISNKRILTGNPIIRQLDTTNSDEIETLRYLIPRNSLLVRVPNINIDELVLCFPFFPPHIQMPIKAGEVVWVMTERPELELKYLYWMCRITAPGFVDDLNYTHLDRQIFPAPNSVSASFPNGGETQTTRTLPSPEGYEEIVKTSSAGLSFQPESVPRLTRRMGDLVLQGSNNSLILLSDDRGWGADETPSNSETSNASKTDEELEKAFAGSIDIVTGRGRFIGDVDEDPANTSSKVIENSREEEETNKYYTNPIEGDPNFVTDSSRVYVSMNTNGDAKLGFEEGTTLPTPFDGEYPQFEDSPYVILKSDNIRIVARKDEDNDINGSIRIVKEGATDEDLATIIITPDGDVQISGARIFIGRHGDDGGADAGDGPGNAEPYMRFSDFKAYMEDTLKAIDDKINGIASDVGTFATTVMVGGPVPTMLGPQMNPVLISGGGSLMSAMQMAPSDTSITDVDMDPIKSTRVFGE